MTDPRTEYKELPDGWQPTQAEWMPTERKMAYFFAIALAVVTTVIAAVMAGQGIDGRIIKGFLLFTLISSGFAALHRNFLPFAFVVVPASIVVSLM